MADDISEVGFLNRKIKQQQAEGSQGIKKTEPSPCS